MKKILLFFFAIVLCGAMCAQNALPLTHPASTDERDEWVGNQDVTMFVRLEDAEFAMLPHVIDPSLTGVMTKLKFYRNPYEDYNTTSYAIKIYEGGELHLVDEVQGLYKSLWHKRLCCNLRKDYDKTSVLSSPPSTKGR